MDTEFYENQLPFLIQPDNIVRYQDHAVWILDRRIYPFEKKFVICKTYHEVAQAVRDMVTQSGGPRFAVAYGMVLAAHSVRDKARDIQLREMEQAAEILGNARPTNNSIKYRTIHMMKMAREALDQEKDVEQVLLAEVKEMFRRSHEESYRVGRYGADLLHDGDGILNHCWAENGIVFLLLAAKAQGKKITAYCSETRPYLQGARLTADAISEIGMPTVVICDNMPGRLMEQGKINAFFSGADRVTRSGHVINKVGTFQAALCANYFDIPYYALSRGPDPNAYTDKDVLIEERDPNETLYCMGMRTATENVSGWYPAFDVTPPELVRGIITDKGVFSPQHIEDYFLK